MKKIMSLFLALLLFAGTFAPMNCVVVSAASDKEANRAAEDLAGLLTTDDDFVDEFLSEKVDRVVVKNRIIIKANDKNVDTYNSVATANLYGYTVVQYDDVKSASSAFSKFEALGYEPSYDSVFSLDEAYEQETEVSYNLNSSLLSTLKDRSDAFEWAYKLCDIDEAVSFYKYRVNREVVVGVLDSGIQYDIDLFKNRVIRTHTDFSFMASGDEMDDNGHGTKVASTVVLCTPENVKVQAFKVAYGMSVTDSSLLLALNHIKNMTKRPDIINMSFSGDKMDSHIENEINELTDMGVLFVSSAGNSGDESLSFPSQYDNVISVAGVEKSSVPSEYSNYGNYVDISAPFAFASYKATRKDPSPKYIYSKGTSFSAPIVTAAAAIVRTEHSNYSPYEVKKKLLDCCVPFMEKNQCKKYGKGIVNFSNLIDSTRSKNIKPNYQSGVYTDEISLKLDCSSTLIDIVYTTDGTLPTLKNGTIYSEPIKIDESTRIIAAAYEKTGSVFHGRFFCGDYYINESEFIIDENGSLLAYLGGKKDVVVPDSIDGTVPVSVSENCFRYCDINNVSLPKTVKNIGDYAFADCTAFASRFSSPSIRTVGKYAFKNSEFSDIILEKCFKADENAFENSLVQIVKLGKLAEINNGLFKNCTKLQIAYLPRLVDCDANVTSAFENCKSLETLFVPKASSLYLDIPSDVDIYVNNNLSPELEADGEYKYNFIAQLQSGFSKLRAFLEKYSYRFCSYKDSGNYAEARGAQIRATDSGMRFGFTWTKIDELETLATNVEYGFVLNYGDTDTLYVDNAQRKVKAGKTVADGNKTAFNLVINEVPPNQRDTVVSVRAYVNIDGWYFYSPIVKRSFNQVATAVLGDEEVDDTVKLSVSEVMAEEK